MSKRIDILLVLKPAPCFGTLINKRNPQFWSRNKVKEGNQDSQYVSLVEMHIGFVVILCLGATSDWPYRAKGMHLIFRCAQKETHFLAEMNSMREVSMY